MQGSIAHKADDHAAFECADLHWVFFMGVDCHPWVVSPSCYHSPVTTLLLQVAFTGSTEVGRLVMKAAADVS